MYVQISADVQINVSGCVCVCVWVWVCVMCVWVCVCVSVSVCVGVCCDCCSMRIRKDAHQPKYPIHFGPPMVATLVGHCNPELGSESDPPQSVLTPRIVCGLRN